MSERRETKRVLIISPEVYPQVKVGGLGKMTAGVAKGLEKEGVEVKMISPEKAIYGDLRSKKIKINYQELGYGAVRRMENWRADWVWTHDWGGTWAGEIIKRFNPGIRIMWTVHSPIGCSGYGYGYSGSNEEKIDWGDSFFDFGALIKRGVVMADKTTTVSKSFAKRLRRSEWFAGTPEIEGINNGVDSDEWKKIEGSWFGYKKLGKRELQKEMGLEIKEVPVFCFVSRIVEQKGVEELILAMDEVLKEYDCQLVILGSGEKKLEEKIRKLRSKYFRKVAIKLEADFEMPKVIFAGSDYLVLPSKEEPFGIVVAEARTKGVIPIVSGVDGLRDQVTDKEDGLVVRSSLREKIEEAIEMFGSEKAAEWRRLGVGLVEDWTKVSKKWLALMNE